MRCYLLPAKNSGSLTACSAVEWWEPTHSHPSLFLLACGSAGPQASSNLPVPTPGRLGCWRTSRTRIRCPRSRRIPRLTGGPSRFRACFAPWGSVGWRPPRPTSPGAGCQGARRVAVCVARCGGPVVARGQPMCSGVRLVLTCAARFFLTTLRLHHDAQPGK